MSPRHTLQDRKNQRNTTFSKEQLEESNRLRTLFSKKEVNMEVFKDES